MAPFYDLLCTAVYHTPAYADEQAVWPNERLAMPLAEATFFADVSREKLIQTGVQLGLSESTARREVATMVMKLPAAADALMAAMTEEYESNPLLHQATAQTKAAELHLLRSVRHIVIGDMLRRAA